MRYAIALILLIVAVTAGGCDTPAVQPRPCFTVGDTLGWITVTYADGRVERHALTAKMAFCADTFTTTDTLPLTRGEPQMPKWTAKDSANAQQDGWDVFEPNTRNAHIEREDDLARFVDDATAKTHVINRARAGSELHQRALDHITNTR